MSARATVLHVDDDPLSRFAITQSLQREGFRVREASTGTEAVRLLAEHPDLILLDVHLPDADGFEICRRLKEDPATATIPVIFLTAVAVQGENRVHGLEIGAEGYLVKPVEPAEVVAHVKALLRARRAEQVQARDTLLLASVRDSIVVTDLEGVVTYWNEGATRLYGWTAQEMVGRQVTDRVPPEARSELASLLQSVAAGQEYSGERQDYRKDGSRVWIEARRSLILDPAGRPAGILGLAHDISDRKQAEVEKKKLEEQYLQAQKMEAVGRLAGGVAHDFNNILTIIMGYADLLQYPLPPDNSAREMAGQIMSASERAAALTRQLLAFSRQHLLAPRVLDLNAVVTNLERMLRRVIGEDIDLAIRLRPDLGHVKADPNQVEQVLLNLAVNARDAMPRGGKLTIETSNVELDEGYARSHAEARPGCHVLLAVSDTGHGMTAEVKARIFEPFFTTKEPGKGTGLGLATVRDIVRQASGHVAVYSEPGLGTTFKVYLPRVEGNVSHGNSHAGQEGIPTGNETLLVVEDEESVRSLIRQVLGNSGYTVLEAGDGDEAVQIARQHGEAIHLLITDVVMPGLGGRPLAEKVLAVHPAMRVLYLSGYTDDAVVRHGILEDEVQFLQKPFAPAALARKVREVLDSPGP